MISDACVDRYYYVFDSREQRVLVRDRATGEASLHHHDSRGPLLDHLGAHRSSPPFRPFARWCARQVEAEALPSHSAAGRLWTAAQRNDPATWQRVRNETMETTMLAVALELPRGRPEAAQLLTLQACTHPDPERAALDAAHMSERWAEFRADAEPEAAARALRARQVDWLLDALSTS